MKELSQALQAFKDGVPGKWGKLQPNGHYQNAVIVGGPLVYLYSVQHRLAKKEGHKLTIYHSKFAWVNKDCQSVAQAFGVNTEWMQGQEQFEIDNLKPLPQSIEMKTKQTLLTQAIKAFKEGQSGAWGISKSSPLGAKRVYTTSHMGEEYLNLESYGKLIAFKSQTALYIYHHTAAWVKPESKQVALAYGVLEKWLQGQEKFFFESLITVTSNSKKIKLQYSEVVAPSDSPMPSKPIKINSKASGSPVTDEDKLAADTWNLHTRTLTPYCADMYLLAYAAVKVPALEYHFRKHARTTAHLISSYLAAAIGGELRHAKHKPVWLKGLKHGSRKMAWTDFKAICDREGMLNAIRGAATIFRDGSWSSSYGGPKWAAVADLLGDWLEGKITDVEFCDGSYQMQHNTGVVFNKWFNDLGNLKNVLDAKFSGDYFMLLRYGTEQARRFFLNAYPEGDKRQRWANDYKVTRVMQ